MTSRAKSVLPGIKPVRATMLLTAFGFWLLLNCYFLARYVQIVREQSDWAGRTIAATVILWLVLTSFYASFHLASFIFSVMIIKWGKQAVRNYDNTPPVAILYPCMNDIKEKSIVACLAQDYPTFALYILDDSTVSTELELVDALREKYGARLSVIRRGERKGFKAGNLNNALREIGDSYEYICVVDADELIPPTFLREMVAIAEGNKALGFVQASHHEYGETEYGKQTGEGINLHWNYFLPARNWFGFVYFYGHGALLRFKSLIAVGEFPEVVSEDIALTTRLREAGYRGYYAYDIKCQEETPPSYQAFRWRNKKIISGTLEFLVRFYPSFLRSPNVSLVEKIDLLIASSIIYLPIPFVGFLCLLYFIMPLVSEWPNLWSLFPFVGTSGQHLHTTAAMFGPLWYWDSLAFIFITIFAPLCYLIPNAIRSPKRVIFYLLRMGTIHLSLCLHTVGASLSWFVTRQASFIPTGDRSDRDSNLFIEYVECSLGLGVLAISILFSSLYLMAVGLSLVLVPILIKKNLDGRLISTLAIIPILLMIIAVCGMPILLVSVTGVFTGIALAHH